MFNWLRTFIQNIIKSVSIDDTKIINRINNLENFIGETMSVVTDAIAQLSALVDKADADIVTVVGIIQTEVQALSDLQKQVADLQVQLAELNVDPATVTAISDKLQASVASLESAIAGVQTLPSGTV